MTQLPIYHISGQGRTGPDPALAAEVQWASPELEARIGLILAGFPDPVPPPKRCHRQHKLRPPDGLQTAAQAAGTNAVRTEVTPKRRRKPSIATMVKRAEKAGKTVTSVSVEGDKVILTFGESNLTDANNPWLAEIEKATKR
jgi:hypothetical protein